MLLRDDGYRGHGPVHQLFPLRWIAGVDEVGITAGNRTDPRRVRTGPNTGGNSGTCKTQGTGGEERAGARRTDHDLQRASLHLVNLCWINKVPAGQDQWP
jgi:hypothetical protein